MSLLITSSQSKDNTNAISIERPERYTNHLKNPLTIPPNSEIAVDSVKINRNPVMDMSNKQKSLFWFGERLDQTQGNPIDDTTSWPIVQENTVGKAVGVQDFVGQYRSMIREAYAYHPDIKTDSSVSGSIMGKSNLGSILDGFTFQIQANTDAPVSAIPPTAQIFNVFDTSPAITYNPSNGSITAGAENTLALAACEGDSHGPISLRNGSVTFNVSATREDPSLPSTRRYAVGLTRAYDHINYQTAWDQDIGLRASEGLGKNADIFFDYAAEAKDGKLRLFHFVSEGSEAGERGQMDEIRYYEKSTPNNSSNSSFATASPINVSEVTELTFNCKNEILTVTDQAGKVIVTVNKSVLTSQDEVTIPKPINQACWKMYPQVYLRNTGDIVAISSYHQRTSSTMDSNIFYGPSDWQARCLGNYFNAVEAKKQQADPVWQNAYFWPRVLEQRPWGFATNASITPKETYKGVNGSNLMDDFENIFIVGRNEKYLQDMATNVWQPNMARLLGMSPYSIFPPTASITTIGSSFTSEVPPETSSQSSAFVRVPRLSHESYNAAVGSQSQILSMIPRFDNAGNDAGALFFQIPEKVYIDLNNAYPIQLTDITVDVVRKDETFVEDLTGSTDIVFHIRRKQKM